MKRNNLLKKKVIDKLENNREMQQHEESAFSYGLLAVHA